MAARQPNGHYAVDGAGRQYEPTGAFGFDAHDEWVEAGHCPAVSRTKAWCVRQPHSSQTRHRSVTVTPDNRPGQGIEWDRLCVRRQPVPRSVESAAWPPAVAHWIEHGLSKPGAGRSIRSRRTSR